jgi:hypothetical protein
MASDPTSLYQQLIERVFLRRYADGAQRVPFGREDIAAAAQELGVRPPRNIGDLIYSFRFRTDLPESVASRAPGGMSWIISLAGRGRYCFVATTLTHIIPRTDMAVTKIPDATPGIIEKYALSDEQALLAKVRYNRLIDVFTGAACYSLQSHLRTAVQEIGQVETDEIYVGLDKCGVHYVFPIQAKGGRDRQSVVQIEQDIAVCTEKFPALVCRPIAAQFMPDGTIALLELVVQDERIAVSCERHYMLVPPGQLSAEDLAAYRRQLPDS